MDIKDYKYNELTEKIVDLLCQKTQTKEKHFFRIITAYYFSKIASSMRCNINLPFMKNIPVNIYSLALLPSGAGKGRATSLFENELMKDFKNNFMKLFLSYGDKQIADRASKIASDKNTDPNEEYITLLTEFNNCGSYPFSFDSGTIPAIKQLRHKLLLANIGSINGTIDEIGNNLFNSTDLLNVFIELYDLGYVRTKITKNTKDNQRNSEIDGRTPTNLLMFGTPTKLLDGDKNEQSFYELLETGYARRLLFSYTAKTNKEDKLNPEELLKQLINPVNDMLTQEISNYLTELSKEEYLNKTLSASKEVMLKILQYKQWCEDRAEEFKEHEEVKKTEMIHRYFKMTKLAGVYAFIDKSNEITINHLKSAIKLVEDSGLEFNKIFKREKNYVKLAKYISEVDNEVTHADLTEDLPFYKGSISNKRELLDLAIAWGYKNNIIIKRSVNDDIEFLKGESLPKTDLNQLIVSASKDLAYNYENAIIDFNDLSKFVTKHNLHWTTHHWKDGHRNKTNLIPKFNLVVLDIDKDLKLNIARELLSNYQYIIYTTKRHTDTLNRFRIVLPLSHTINLGSEEYSKFMENVFNWLPFDVDDATKDVARKWLTNKGDLYVNTGELLDAMKFIPKTKKSIVLNQKREKVSNMTNLQNWFYKQIGEGNRNNIMFKYASLLADNGYDLESVRNGLMDFNSKLPEPLDEKEINGTILVSIARKMTSKGLI